MRPPLASTRANLSCLKEGKQLRGPLLALLCWNTSALEWSAHLTALGVVFKWRLRPAYSRVRRQARTTTTNMEVARRNLSLVCFEGHSKEEAEEKKKRNKETLGFRLPTGGPLLCAGAALFPSLDLKGQQVSPSSCCCCCCYIIESAPHQRASFSSAPTGHLVG